MSSLIINTFYFLTTALLITKVVHKFSGSPLAKNLVKVNERCQYLKSLKNLAYTDCQNELDRLVSRALETGDIDVKKCKSNPEDNESAFCHLQIWYMKNTIEVTLLSVVQSVNGEDVATKTTENEETKNVQKRSVSIYDSRIGYQSRSLARRKRAVYKVNDAKKVTTNKQGQLPNSNGEPSSDNVRKLKHSLNKSDSSQSEEDASEDSGSSRPISISKHSSSSENSHDKHKQSSHNKKKHNKKHSSLSDSEYSESSDSSQRKNKHIKKSDKESNVHIEFSNKPNQAVVTSLKEPNLGYPTGPNTGYPTGPNTGYATRTNTRYPTGPNNGYPNGPNNGYPNGPNNGYPNGPSNGYPNGPIPGYPNRPIPGYPNGPNPGPKPERRSHKYK